MKRVEIKPILKEEVYDLIDKFVEIRDIEYSIATNYAKLLKQEDPNSFNKLLSAGELVDDMYIAVRYFLGHSKKYGDPSRFNSILKSIKKLLSRDDVNDNLKKLKIKGRLDSGDDIETFNILEELMLTERKIAKLDGNTRAIDPNSMYQEIISSYSMLKEELWDYINPVSNESDGGQYAEYIQDKRD